MSHSEALSRLTDGSKSMKRTFASYSRCRGCGRRVRGACACRAGGRQVSEPAATTVYGRTPQRLWATTVAGAGAGRRGRRWAGSGPEIVGRAFLRERGAIVALVVGQPPSLTAGASAIANGGPGTGNGVVGGAAALVLGLIATILGGRARARSQSTA